MSSSRSLTIDATTLLISAETAPRAGDKIDLREILSRCSLAPATIKKILEGRPPSRYVERKIRAGLAWGSLSGEAPNRPSRMDRLREVYRLYQEKGTLAAVGREMGLSRERVRQLLIKGAEIGLFEYKTRRFSLPDISREKVLEDYKRLLTLKGIAEENQISVYMLRRLCLSLLITKGELAALRMERRRMQCIDRYISIVEGLGHHPTTTELHRLKPGCSLPKQIRRSWGSFDTFRSALKECEQIVLSGS